MSEKSRPAAESKNELYTVFSILSAFTIQAMVFPSLQSDLKVVVAITGFLASFLFIVLKAGRPEDRIVSSSVKRSLGRNGNLLEFIVGCDILFNGWKSDNFATTHRWMHQIVDRTQILPENPTTVPNSNSTFVFYSLLILPLFSWLLYSFDIIIVLIFEIIIILIGITILYLSDSYNLDCIRYLIEFETLRDHLISFKETEENRLGVPDVQIIYDKNKSVLITHDTLKEMVPHLERMIREKQWARFMFVFEDFEQLFLNYLRDIIPLKGVNDLITSWSTYFQDTQKKYTVEHQLKRIREAHNVWSELTKTETKVSKLEETILDLPDLLAFVDTLSIDEIRVQEAEAVASVINRYTPSQDIRFNQFTKILCTKLQQYEEQMKDDFAEKMIRQCLGSEPYLVHVLNSTIDYWSREYRITKEKSVEIIKSELDGTSTDLGIREQVVRLFKEMSEPSFDNQPWEGYRRYIEDRTLSRLAMYEALLETIESEMDLPSSMILETLLSQAPRSIWKHCGSKGLELLIDQYTNSSDREIEMALIEIISSSNEVNRIRVVTQLSKEQSVPSNRIMVSIIECLFSDSERVRIGISSELLRITEKLKPESIPVERVSLAINDPHEVVRKNIQELMKKGGKRKPD